MDRLSCLPARPLRTSLRAATTLAVVRPRLMWQVGRPLYFQLTMGPLKLTSRRKQRRRRRRSPSRTPMMTSSHLELLAMQMIKWRRTYSSKEVTRTTSSPLTMQQTATHKLQGKRRKRRRRAQFCLLSVSEPTTKPSTLRRYPLLMMTVASLPNNLVGASREPRPPRAWKRTWRRRLLFILSSLRTRRRRPSDRSLRSRQKMILTILLTRTKRLRSSRAVVE